MKSHRWKIVAAVVFAGLSFGLIMPAGAEEAKPLPAASDIPKSPEDIAKIIAQLDSVRDYERLYWILDAAEHQVPPVRAALLKRLDEQVQQLIQAEVEQRTASAVSTIQALAGGVPEAAKQTKAKESLSNIPVAASAEAPKTAAISYEETKAKVDNVQFSKDPKESVRQMQRLAQDILSIPDPNQRAELSGQLQRRRMQLLQEEVEAKKAELTKQIEQEAAQSGSSATQ